MCLSIRIEVLQGNTLNALMLINKSFNGELQMD